MWIFPYKNSLDRVYQLFFDFLYPLFLYVLLLYYFIDPLDLVRISTLTKKWIWEKKITPLNTEKEDIPFLFEESIESSYCFEKSITDIFSSSSSTSILQNTSEFLNGFTSCAFPRILDHNRIKKQNEIKGRMLKEENDDSHYELSSINTSQTKYYLVGKIRDIGKKKEEKRKMQVIYISGEEKEDKTTTRHKKEECTFCVVKTEIPIYALKVREEIGIEDKHTNRNTLIYEKNKTRIYKKQRTDVKLYYDYEHMYVLPNKYREKRIKDLQHLQYILDLLKQPYLMIDFTQRLLLQVPSKYNNTLPLLPEEETFIKRKENRRFNTMSFEKENPWILEKYQHKKTYYSIKHKIGKGSFGEVWSGFSINKNTSFDEVVLKRFIIRMKEDKETETENKLNDMNEYSQEDAEEEARKNAMREVYFGEILKNCEHISRFIEYFEEYEIEEHSQQPFRYIWLVFANEGYSLSNHLFESNEKKSGMVQPSILWWSIKKQTVGMLVLRDLIYQILKGIHTAHKKKITHRDIKMDNIFVSSTTPFTVRIGDWGSAVEFENPHFMFLPKEEEETQGYQPPESLIGPMKNDYLRKPYYDIWGVGIVFLQFVLGTMNPLEVKNKRNQMKFEREFSKISKQAVEEAIFLQSLSELCLTPWVNSEEQLIIYPKTDNQKSSHKETKGFSGFTIFFIPFIIRRSIEIRNLQIPSIPSYIKNRNESAHIVYNIISEKYKSIMPIPQSSECKDWMCVDTYSKLRTNAYINLIKMQEIY